MAKHGKKYQEATKQIDRIQAYPPGDAIKLARDSAFAKFDETVELHVRTSLDPRHADQQLRSTVVLPHGLGKTVRVLVFAEGEAVRTAEQAGADVVGGEELIKRVEEGFLEFDVALATRDIMSKASRLGRVLGPRGLMPNPRTNTVVAPEDLPRGVRDAKQGRVEIRLDRTALIHASIGKVSHSEEALSENLTALVEAIVRERPAGAKGQFIKSMTLATTMGPAIKLDLPAALSLGGASIV